MSTRKTSKPAWDRPPRKEAKIKNLPKEDQETLWLLMHPADKDTPAYTYDQALAYLQEEHDVSCSLSTLWDWRDWYGVKQRMERAAQRAEQAKLELAKDPSLTAEDLERIAQVIFTNEALQKGDAKVYVQLAKLNLARKRQMLDRDKLSVASKSKIEAGLDALFAEIKGNKKAEAIFAQLKEVVSQA